MTLKQNINGSVVCNQMQIIVNGNLNKSAVNSDFYYKFILCMLLNLRQAKDREDLAISCLLEEDQKAQLEQTDWTEKHQNRKTKGSITNYLDFKGNRQRGTLNRRQQQRSSRNKFNHEMLEHTSQDTSDQANLEEKILKQSKDQSSWLEKEGAYWCSKVNWTSVGFKDEHRTQPKMPKKLRFEYENNACQGRRSRYDFYEASRNEEYKTNLIYNILKGEAERIMQQQTKIRSIAMNKADSAIDLAQKSLRDTHYSCQNKNDYDTENLSKYVQQSMRDTMKKIWAKNHSSYELTSTSNAKPMEGSKGTFVRQMLINLQKKKQESQKPQPIAKKVARYLTKKQDIKEPKKSQKSSSKDSQRQIYNLVQQSRKRINRVIDLNMEAERVYHSRSVNHRRQIKQIA